MAELSLKDYVLEGMKPYWAVGVKHADAYTPGVADVSGWLAPAGNVFIELKALRSWPARAATPAKFKFDDLQKRFLKGRKGWLLCRVGREYYLYNWAAAQSVDTEIATRSWLIAHCWHYWIGAINFKELSGCVARQYV